MGVCVLCVDVHVKYTAAVIPVVPSLMEHTMHEYTHSHLSFHTLIHYSQTADNTLISTTQTFKKAHCFTMQIIPA